MRSEKAGPMPDPTYVRELIEANPIWRRAFELSELFNDNAPIGWSAFIEQAETEAAKLKVEHAGEKLAITIYFAGPVEKVNLPDAIAFIRGKYPDAEIAVEHVREPLQRKG